MHQSSCSGVVRNGSVILEDDVQLAEGTRVIVTPVDPALGSPRAVLAAASAPPHLDPKDVAEFERLIESGKRPLSRRNPLIPNRSKKKR
jgi:hypothetical protein